MSAADAAEAGSKKGSHTGLKTFLKVAGSLASICAIAYVTSQDSKKDYKELNTVIVVTQALMMLLLWTTESFLCGWVGPFRYIWLLWGALYLTSSICVYIRFEDSADKEAIYLAFGIGNAILFALSNTALARGDCPPRPKPPVRISLNTPPSSPSSTPTPPAKPVKQAVDAVKADRPPPSP